MTDTARRIANLSDKLLAELARVEKTIRRYIYKGKERKSYFKNEYQEDHTKLGRVAISDVSALTY